MEDERETAFSLVQAGEFEKALPILEAIVDGDPSDWNAVYMAGQCWRFLGDFDKALELLHIAVSLNQNEPSVLLALGVAQQLAEQYSEALVTLKRAIGLNPDYVMAFNSLALTYKKVGELQKAKEIYEEGIKALSRQIVKRLENNRRSQIFKHSDLGASLWIEYALFGATYISTLDSAVDSVAFPSGELAAKEEAEETHAGLYWIDQQGADRKKTRLFLPNYFNTFMRVLCGDRAYAELTGNRGTVLDMLGEQEDAQKHFQEATAFLPGSR